MRKKKRERENLEEKRTQLKRGNDLSCQLSNCAGIYTCQTSLPNPCPFLLKVSAFPTIFIYTWSGMNLLLLFLKLLNVSLVFALAIPNPNVKALLEHESPRGARDLFGEDPANFPYNIQCMHTHLDVRSCATMSARKPLSA